MMREILAEHTVLYAEDDTALQASTVEYLQRYFREVYTADDGMTALEVYKKQQPSVVILDIDMPHKDGLHVAKAIRESNGELPIVMLTALTDVDKLLEATELHLCKYLVKPVEPEAFRQTLQKIAEILKAQAPSIDLGEGYRWDIRHEKLFCHQVPVALSHKEKRLLALLLKHHRHCVTFEEIMAYVWEAYYDEEISIESVKLQVTLLRKKLPKESIKNVYGKGYVLN